MWNILSVYTEEYTNSVCSHSQILCTIYACIVYNRMYNICNVCLLVCSNNSISEKGAEELGKSLEVNYHLKGLLLWKNRIFHTGAEALVEGLMGNSTLESLGVGVLYV